MLKLEKGEIPIEILGILNGWIQREVISQYKIENYLIYIFYGKTGRIKIKLTNNKYAIYANTKHIIGAGLVEKTEVRLYHSNIEDLERWIKYDLLSLEYARTDHLNSHIQIIDDLVHELTYQQRLSYEGADILDFPDNKHIFGRSMYKFLMYINENIAKVSNVPNSSAAFVLIGNIKIDITYDNKNYYIDISYINNYKLSFEPYTYGRLMNVKTVSNICNLYNNFIDNMLICVNEQKNNIIDDITEAHRIACEGD